MGAADNAGTEPDPAAAGPAPEASQGMTATRTVIQPIGDQNPINLSLSCAYAFCGRSFARFLNPGYAQAAMNSVVDTIVVGSASAEAQLPSRVLEIRPEESK